MIELIRRAAFTLAAAALLALGAAPAQADLIYTLNQRGLGGQSSLGNVTLTQTVASTGVDQFGTIHVQVNLVTPTPAEVVFANTAKSSALTWNLTGVSDVSITNITEGFGIRAPNRKGYLGGQYGYFGYAVACMTNCDTGAGASGGSGPLAFDISGNGLTLASFVANVYRGADVFFSADLGVNGTAGVVGSTGAGACQHNCGEARTSFFASAAVPEPGSLPLLGSAAALLMVLAMRRRV